MRRQPRTLMPSYRVVGVALVLLAATGCLFVGLYMQEDISWTAQSPVPVVLMTKGLPLGTPHNTPNITRGREALSYLQYILDEYDNLPDRVVFAHGHQSSWHVKDMLSVLAVLDPTAYEYAGLSNTYSEGFRQDHYDLVSTWWHQMHMAIWIDKPFPTKLDGVKEICCATFVVSRERILAHPKEFYKHLFTWLVDTRLPDALSGRMLEWTWHVIFGEPWLSLPPNPARLCPRAPAVCRNRPF